MISEINFEPLSKYACTGTHACTGITHTYTYENGKDKRKSERQEDYRVESSSGLWCKTLNQRENSINDQWNTLGCLAAVTCDSGRISHESLSDNCCRSPFFLNSGLQSCSVCGVDTFLCDLWHFFHKLFIPGSISQPKAGWSEPHPLDKGGSDPGSSTARRRRPWTSQVTWLVWGCWQRLVHSMMSTYTDRKKWSWKWQGTGRDLYCLKVCSHPCLKFSPLDHRSGMGWWAFCFTLTAVLVAAPQLNSQKFEQMHPFPGGSILRRKFKAHWHLSHARAL